MNINNTFLFSISTQDSYLCLSSSLSKKKLPTLELLIQAVPGPSEHIPRLSVRFSTMSSRYFFLNISFYLSDFEQEGD
jgi:hypothetical protein